MAYVPVTQSKKTSGYVPVSKKTPTLPGVLSTQLPTQQLIRDISKPAPAPAKPLSINERNAETKRLTGSVPFAATKTGIAVNTVLGLPKAALDVAREIPRGIVGTAAQGTALALGVDQKDISIQPEGLAQRAFLGDKPIQPAKEGADLLKLVGVNEKTAAKLGPVLYAGLTLSDFISGPGKKQGLIEAAKLAGDTKQASIVLRNAGITDDLIKSFKLDEKVVAAKTDAEVEQIFKDIPKEVVQKTVPLPKLPPKAADVPETTPVVKAADPAPTPPTTLLEEAKKYKSADEFVKAGMYSPARDSVARNEIRKSLAQITETKKANTLKENPNNPPTDKSTVNIRAEDIREGKRPYVVIDGDMIIDGHHTYQAYLKEGIEDIPVVTKSQLEDIWNQAQKTAPAAAPKAELPALPKLPPEMVQGLKTAQADDTINRAVLDRYKTLARKPDVVDTDIVKAAKDSSQPSGASTLAGRLLTPISSRLRRINPILETTLRKFEFAVNQNTKKSIDAVRPLVVGSSKMSAPDRKLFSLARLNGDREVIDALATKYNLTNELKAAEKALEDVRLRANEAGMDIAKRENYSPRMVKNPKAYLNYWRNQPDWGDINRLIQAEAEKKGIKYGDLMKDPEKVVSIINNYIRGYGNKTVLAAPSFSKQRTIQVLDEELSEFYEDADSALTTYMIRMNDEIEGRKFFGKKADGDAEITDSIGTYVMKLVADGKIKPQQQEEVGDILRARFHRGKMYGVLDVYRNAEYISTMGSPISAITQIGDFSWSLYDNGFWNTAKATVGKKKLTREDLGLDASIMNEFTRDTWSGKAVDRTFKLVGLDKLARLGQETFVNANLAKLQRQARRGDDVLRTQVEKLFDADEVDTVLKELAGGQITERTKFMAFNRLLDFQPLTKSEMPQAYLEHPNGRMFYMLKSFTLKQYDIYRRESFDLIASGDKAKVKQGVKNLLSIAALFMAANATADEIKDLLLDRDTPPSDRVVDNLWRLAGASKYDVYKAREEGIGTTILKKILFPASILDRATKDFETIATDKEYEKGPMAGENYKFESTQTIPVGGKLYYWWFGRGDQKQEYKESQGTTTTETTGTIPELPPLPKLPKLPSLPKI